MIMKTNTRHQKAWSLISLLNLNTRVSPPVLGVTLARDSEFRKILGPQPNGGSLVISMPDPPKRAGDEAKLPALPHPPVPVPYSASNFADANAPGDKTCLERSDLALYVRSIELKVVQSPGVPGQSDRPREPKGIVYANHGIKHCDTRIRIEVVQFRQS